MSFFFLNVGAKYELLTRVHKLGKFNFMRCICGSENPKPNEKVPEESKSQVPAAYHPAEVEAKWYEFWESRNYFKPSKAETDSFVILLPPPNVTGTLHLGHALTCTLQDVILRWKRMKGESVLWVPGIDHAGIATQVAVEKYLRQSSGLSRHDVGKEEFVKTIWEWKNEKAENIIKQLRKLGASLDWSKLIFTLDSSHSQLVKKSFIQLFNDGFIYRKESLINWSCALKSSISDIEVDWIEIEKKENFNVPGYDKPVTFGQLFQFAYKVCNEDSEIVVSTTRPETILGDVAVAIHPDHPDVSKFENKYVWHPFRNEKIPIIVDEFVDVNLGTGAVKITPSHSLIDYQVGLKHKLRFIPIINESGLINKIGMDDKFSGLKRFDARWAMISELKKLNLYRGVKAHSMVVPVCSRSGDVVELLLKKQWFLKCDSLMKKAVQAVETGDLKIIPESHRNVWFEWLSKKPSRDWNLSRQLWWGHQIPMYECRYKEKTIWIPGLSLEDAKSGASKSFGAPSSEIVVVQDPDVLDTWFSSGLLSLNAVINQDRSPPISLMVTGHDILFFWLSRMVMLSIQLAGKLPFNEVLLHGLMCDSAGKKMSKSAGNVIHPDDVIYGVQASDMEKRLEQNFQEKQISEEHFKKALAFQKTNFPKGIPECGVDALRFSLCSSNVLGFFINFDVDVCLSNRFFCNKIYQVFNYFSKITRAYKERRKELDLEDLRREKGNLNCFDLWILSRLSSIIRCVDTNLSSYRFDPTPIRLFLVNEFCNFYVESTKATLENCSSDRYKTTVSVFFHCFENSLRLLSPFMPYLTEYLYQAMPEFRGYDKWESLTVGEFPSADDWIEFRDPDLELRFQKLLNFLNFLRSAKVLFRMQKRKTNVFIKCPDELGELLFGDVGSAFSKMGDSEKFTRVESLKRKNVIPVNVTEGFAALVKHDYDKATLLNLFGSRISKENELKRKLDKLLIIRNDPKWESLLTGEKYQHTKEITRLEEELKVINTIQSTVDNCDRT